MRTRSGQSYRDPHTKTILYHPIFQLPVPTMNSNPNQQNLSDRSPHGQSKPDSPSHIPSPIQVATPQNPQAQPASANNRRWLMPSFAIGALIVLSICCACLVVIGALAMVFYTSNSTISLDGNQSSTPTPAVIRPTQSVTPSPTRPSSPGAEAVVSGEATPSPQPVTRKRA